MAVGDDITVTARIDNIGCAPIGLPKYRLSWVSEDGAEVFDPASPQGVTHSVGVSPGSSDEAHFVLTAVAPGQVSFGVLITFEVHLGYPGPAYFAGDGATLEDVAVVPGRPAIHIPVALKAGARE